MRGDRPEADDAWLENDPGPVVRPYTISRGRVRPEAGGFDLVAFVLAVPSPDVPAHHHLQPEHQTIIAIAQKPISVAEVASHLDLALGVVRVLLGDLLVAGLITMHEPAASPLFLDNDILKAVVNGLRAL